MPKANSYKIDENVTFNDIIFGSDGDNNLKTKNFTIKSLIGLLEGGDSIKTPLKKTISLSEGQTFQFGLDNNSITVASANAPVLLEFIKEESITGSSSTDINKYLFLFPLGAGTYSPISSAITFSELTLLNTSKPTFDDVSALADTVTYDLGNLTGQDFIDVINAKSPSLDFSDSTKNYFVTFFDNGERQLYKFVGTNGAYGLNDLQATADDFIEFSAQIADEDNIKVAKQVVTLPQTSYASESDEIDAIVSLVNAGTTLFNVSSKEIYIVEANQLTNDVGNAYKTLYLIGKGKGSYGSGGDTIASADVIKIRGEQIDENLSSLNNDVGFVTSVPTVPTNVSAFTNDVPYATENYVDDLVSFRGEKTSTADVLAITSLANGDYATVNTTDAKQLWSYIGGEWNLVASEHSVLTRSSAFSISNLLHNKTIICTTGGFTITLPTTVIDGIEVYIKNESTSTLTLASSGTISGETQILPNRSVYITKSGTTFYSEINEKKKGEDIEHGLYLYDDTQAAQTLSAGVFSDLSNNGAGVNTYKDPLDVLPNAYNVSTDRFDFTGLSIGDVISISVSGDLTTDSTTQVFDAVLVLGLGSGNEQRRPFFSSKYFRDAGTYTISEFDEFFISSSLIRDNPAKIEVKTSGAGSIDAVQLKIKITKRS